MKQHSKSRLWKILYTGIIFSGCLCAIFLICKYSEIYCHIGNAPRGINISIYTDPYSRGFSWWTEHKTNEQSFLYLSETAFEESHLSTATTASGDIANRHFDGILYIKGQSQQVMDPSRWGKLFFISYCNHTVAVENLLPEQTYYYALGGNGEYHFGKFRTDSDDKTVIINFNDFQTSQAEKLHMGGKTLQAALLHIEEPIDFFAFGGDFTDVFSTSSQTYTYFSGWIESRESLSEFTSGIPMVMTPGNHDAVKNLFVSNNMVSYDGISDTGGYFSFDYNNVHFAVLNSNEFGEIQHKWIQDDLASSNASEQTDWIILMLHKGPYTTGDHGFSMEREYIETISTLASQYHVDLVLQAHDHTFSKTWPYRWDSSGYTPNAYDESVVNYSPKTIWENGMEYDDNPQGTYYISCGASGHRLGENTEYASPYGEKSYTNRFYKIAISKIKMDSKYARTGSPASMDLGCSMFGILQIHENTLVYDFYATEEGRTCLIDRLAVMKH